MKLINWLLFSILIVWTVIHLKKHKKNKKQGKIIVQLRVLCTVFYNTATTTLTRKP